MAVNSYNCLETTVQWLEMVQIYMKGLAYCETEQCCCLFQLQSATFAAPETLCGIKSHVQVQVKYEGGRWFWKFCSQTGMRC